MITLADFQNIEIQVGTILTAEKVAGADRLLQLTVDLGQEKRQLVAGIAQQYQAQDIIGKQVLVLCNLQPATIRGVESNGMVLCAGTPEPILLSPVTPVPNGSKVR